MSDIFVDRNAFGSAVERLMIAARQAVDADGKKVVPVIDPRSFAIEARQAIERAIGQAVTVPDWDEMIGPDRPRITSREEMARHMTATIGALLGEEGR